jgi:V/A-type H+-transporting ATPase subunit K
MLNLGLLGTGIVMGLAAIGSALGIGYAGSATIGAWKKCYAANKPAPMMLLAFAGAPLTQTFYGYILMGQMKEAAIANPEQGWLYFGFGLVSGLAMALSAIVQGKAGAASADAQAETGRGFAQFLAVVGIAETVALFVMVFSMISLG